MTQTVFAHIGAFKTGTTYIQQVLVRNRDRLATEGILIPGKARIDQIHAVEDLLDSARRGYRRPGAKGAWQRLVERIEAWPGPTAVMSMEHLSLATPDQVRNVVADLRPAELHTILTARDLGRVLPSAWQQRIMNAKVLTWDDFMAGLTDPRSEHGGIAKGFWRQQDLPAILRRWNTAVPGANIHVVTVPPAESPPTVLLERFGEVIGADATTWDTDVGRNEALGAVETELLRLVNARLDERLPWPVYRRAVKNAFARDMLANRPNQFKLRLPTEHYAWAEARASELVDALKADGYPVVGSLDELLPTATAGSGHPGPDDVTTEEVLAAAADTIAALVVSSGGGGRRHAGWLRERGRSLLRRRRP